MLLAADDNRLRTYYVQSLDSLTPIADNATSNEECSRAGATDSILPSLRLPAGELIYDYAWYPWACGTNVESFCFAVTARGHPVHLYDGHSGELRCSYCPYNTLEEMLACYSVGFTPEGSKLLTGCLNAVQIFDLQRPGRDHDTIVTFRKRHEGQPGIISCLAFPSPSSSNPDIMAAGSYSNAAALYDLRTKEQLAVLEGHAGGVTHMLFSACGNYLYTGARRDANIYCWDARYLSGTVYSLERSSTGTNQRIYFDIEPMGRTLASGGEDGMVWFYDLREGKRLTGFHAAADTVNGCHFHPILPYLATASGHRRFPLADPYSCSEDEEESHLAPPSLTTDTTTATATPARKEYPYRYSTLQKGDWSHLARNENCLGVWRLSSFGTGTAGGGTEDH